MHATITSHVSLIAHRTPFGYPKAGDTPDFTPVVLNMRVLRDKQTDRFKKRDRISCMPSPRSANRRSAQTSRPLPKQASGVAP